MSFKQSLDSFKSFFRERLSGTDALPQLSLLGLLVGLLTAAVILFFRLAIEWPLAQFLPNGDPENFEGLSQGVRLLLPLCGAVLIGAIWYRLRISQRKVGIVFVIERLNYHQGYITFKSLVTQFVGGVLTILSGQSSGREGPAVHLGAAVSSLLGQKFKLPNNSIRTLVGCGTAAAISASFNTPIAGVIFAMEVVMMEYTVAGFTPVILASVTAAILSQVFYGTDPAFFVPQLEMNSLFEVPFIIVCGIVTGLASVFFVRLLKVSINITQINIFYRITIAGIITAVVAYFFPEVMGVGYDTVNTSLLGGYSFGLLCAIAFAKIVVTAVSVGLGMPSGLIGPTLFIGATVGGALGLIANLIFPEVASSPGFYAMLGMGAMMGSVLQAPLSALMALLELTQNPNIILPGMLVIVVSSMFASEVFKQKSVFMTILEAQGLNINNGPMTQALRRVSVGAIMERKFVRSNSKLSLADAKELLRQEPKWILINNSQGMPFSLLPVVDLANYLADADNFSSDDNDDAPDDTSISLLEIPAQRQEVCTVSYQATLQEALDQLADRKTDYLYVERLSAPTVSRVIGIVARTDVENYYRYKRN